MKRFYFLATFFLLLVSLACSSVTVYSDYDRSTNFNQYKTYAFYKKGIDKVEGFEDMGSQGTTEKPANHAIAFMVRGLCAKWKQPVGYFDGPIQNAQSHRDDGGQVHTHRCFCNRRKRFWHHDH